MTSIHEGSQANQIIIDKVKLEDLENGILTASWALEASHPSVSGDQVDSLQVENMLKTVLIGTLISSVESAWNVSDEMNKLFPDFELTEIEEFLTKVWEDKP